jgi:endonuclease/exonuclease/phosphatase family metal-dependent hydrolase
MSNTLARIPFAWWNTSVAPPSIRPNATAKHRAAVSSITRTLVEEIGCLVIALAEVRRESVLAWIPDERRAGWDAITDTSDERHDFDIALAYDRTALALVDAVWTRDFHAGQAVRAGLVATFALPNGSGPLVLAVAHWRSDAGNAKDAEARRSRAAEALRGAISASISALGGIDVPVLLLGDFNAEPFAEQFNGNLPTARSRDTVQRHRPRSPTDLLFYNAAWRWLGERDAWDGKQKTPTLAGTYRTSKGDKPTAWRTFDQVLVSPSLLRDFGWSLDERYLGIHVHDEVFDRARSRPRAPFDHLPIVGQLQWLPGSEAD